MSSPSLESARADPGTVVVVPGFHLPATRVLSGATSHDQLLYFTSNSLLADDRSLIFISDRTGHPNLFAHDLRSGTGRQLTFNAEGGLKSYVYFDGQPYRGLGKASVSLHAASGTVYYRSRP
ncbi:MAG: hypothetical protein EXS39_01055 [Opitutaceae bacterium]|nr:hypothetical protein [Opitutaceae bacterium]